MRKRLLWVLIGLLVILGLGHLSLWWYFTKVVGPGMERLIEFTTERLFQNLPRDKDTIERLRKNLPREKPGEEKVKKEEKEG